MPAMTRRNRLRTSLILSRYGYHSFNKRINFSTCRSDSRFSNETLIKISPRHHGFFLAVYITDNSVLQDGFMKGVRTYLDDAVVYKYDSPYQDKDVLEKELMYIIEIKNED